MKKLIFIFLFCLLNSLSAQDYKINWGPEYKLGGLFQDGFRFLGWQGNYYYLVEERLKDNLFYQFDTEHNLVSKQSINFQHNGKNLMLEHLLKTSEGTFAFFHIYDKEDKFIIIYSCPFVDGKFGELREIYKHPYAIAGPILTSFDASIYGFYMPQRRALLNGGITIRPFPLNTYRNNEIAINPRLSNTYKNNEIILSTDQSKVALINNALSFDPKRIKDSNNNTSGSMTLIDKEQVYALAVFDSKMQRLWEKHWELNEKKPVTIIDKAVAKDGSLYILVSLPDNTKVEYLPQRQIQLYRFTENSIESVDVDLEDTELGFTTIGFQLQDKEDETKVFITGLYTDRQKDSGELGVFTMRFGMDLKRGDVNFKEFGRDITSQYVDEKDLDKGLGLGEGKMFFISKVFQWDDGTVSFIASFTDGDFMITRFTKEGELMKVRLVEKFYSPYISWLLHFRVGFSSALKDDKLYLLFNDELFAKERKQLKAKKSDDYTELVVLDKNLEIEFQSNIYKEARAGRYYLLPTFSDYHKNEWLFLRTNGVKKYQFGTIKLDE